MRRHRRKLTARLTAALLALVMALTLAPAALAVNGCPNNGNGAHVVPQWETVVEANCHQAGVIRGVCSLCRQTVYDETPRDLNNHDAVYTDEGTGYHSAVCTYHPDVHIPLEAHKINSSGVCSKCGAVDYSDVTLNLPENLTVPVALNSADAKLSVGEVRLTLGKSANITDDYNISYNWYYNNASVADTAEYVLPASITGKEGVYYFVLHVNATPKNSLRKPIGGSCTVTVQVEELITASAAVSRDEASIFLGDPDSWSGESVSTQIYAAVQDSCPRNADPSYVVFHALPNSTVGSLGVSALSASYYFEGNSHRNSLDDVKFTVATGTGATTGDYTVGFTAYDTAGNSYAGVLTISVQQYTGNMDVVLSTAKGTPVSFTTADFEDFWTRTYPSGTLDSIRFKETPRSTEGSLHADYISAAASGIRVTTKDLFYVVPGRNQYGVDAVTFVPGVKQTEYITLDFEARGIKNNGSVGYLDGTVYLFIHSGGSADVSVTVSSTGTALSPASFQKAYQSAAGGTGSSFYIQLLEVPAKGSLYVGRTATRPGTLLTARSIANYPFSYSDSRGESISTLTYIPAAGTASESIRYVACSTQGKPLYTGRITFTTSGTTPPTNPTTPTTTGLVLNLTSPAAGVKLSAAAFETLPGATAPKLTTVQFTPVSATYGAFYYGRTDTAPGTVIATGNTYFSAVSVNPPVGSLSLNSLTFVPAAGATGVIPIPFTAFDASNNRYTGTLRITVSGTTPGTTNPGTTTPGTTNPGTTTPGTPATKPKKTFTDVPSTLWSYPYITELTTSGVLNGYDDGTFKPNDAVTLGAALKMIMIAANPTAYGDLPATGSHWASGYLDRAIQDGLLSASANHQLDRNVSRYTIAEITTKAMGLQPVTNAASSPFSDMALSVSSASYVLPLYNIGVLQGSIDSKTGARIFQGTTAIKREDFAAIIWRVQSYVQTGVVGTISVS